ncbi:MAG: hypothetical protein ACRDK7_13000 [Solirubrobacteraceae bacterium]
MRELDTELRKAQADERDAAERVKRLQAAQAALLGQAAPRKHQRRLSRADIREYLAAHQDAPTVEIAEALGSPATNVGTHLSNGKRAGEFQQHRGRWSLTETSRG